MRSLFILIFLFVLPLGAQTFSGDDVAPQLVEIPLIEVPFNTSTNYAWPSMHQSLLLSSSFLESVHTGIQRQMSSRELPQWRQKIVVFVFDFISAQLPLAGAWLHEEWHRAVMTKNHVGSQNDVYKLQLFKNAIAVSHVTDDDLIRLKKDSPADMVRLSAAGMEAQIEQNLYLEKNNFFNRSPSFNSFIYFYNTISVYGYISSCGQKSSTQFTMDQNKDDGTDVSARDFTGLDCLGWVYDLYRPDEPYQSRGVHPSGIGIDRYRTLENLTEEEKSFLRKQAGLSALNFIDPFIFGKNDFKNQIGGEDIVWNAKLQHFLTSFGYDVAAVVFLKFREKNWLLKSHQYFNTKRYFPGFSVELYKWAFSDQWSLSPELAFWEQPAEQRYDSVKGTLGASFELTAYYKYSDNVQPFVAAAVKDQGWKPGNVELGRSFNLGSGFSLVF